MSDPDAEASVGAKTEEEQERPEAIDEADTDGLVDDNVNLEPDEEYSPAISALPPRIVKQEENQVEVSASPAFQCLDELFQEGKLTGTKVAFLKSKYTELHETLKKTRESEANLLQEAKGATMELERQTVELEKADNFPESSNSEVTKMREQLLKYNNDLSQAEERQYQLEYKMETLEEELKIVEREYNRLPKQGEVEKKIKELQNDTEEMKKEIVQRIAEKKTLGEDLETTRRQITTDKKEYEKLQDELEKLKANLVQINSLPGQTAKEADRINRQKNIVLTNLETLNIEYKEHVEVAKKLEQKKKVLEEEKLEADTELDNLKDMLNEREREYDSKMKEFEVQKEREVTLMGDRATYDMNLRHILLEK